MTLSGRKAHPSLSGGQISLLSLTFANTVSSIWNFLLFLFLWCILSQALMLTSSIITLVILSPWEALVAQEWRIHLPMQETWVRSLGQEDSLEKEVATNSSILAWEIPWTEAPWQAVVHGVAKSWTWLSDETTIRIITLLTFCQTLPIHCHYMLFKMKT